MKTLTIHTIALTLALVASQTASAAFTISVDQAAFTNVAPGSTVTVPFTLTHDVSSGPSSLSSYTFRFFGPETQTIGFENDIVTGATEGLTIGNELGAFSFNNANNQIAPQDFTFVGADLGDGGAALLFSLDVEVGNLPSYQVGVDFRNAARGFADISTEFSIDGSFDTANLSPAGINTGGDTSFTITTAAVPEPSSLAVLGLVSGVALAVRRRRTAARQSQK